jgi:DNA-binding transcriptional LysR family regulator
MSATDSRPAARWQELEVRHLLALLAVVETGTFSAAADQLGYTQSAVSQQVATLERIVGAAVFERPGGRRPVRLTAAGQVLLTHGRAVIARVGSAAADLRALAAGDRGELRVGTMPSVGTKVLPRLLRDFRAQWPGIELVLRESRGSADLVQAVETGDIDVTFLDIGPHPTGSLQVQPLLDDPMVLLAPAEAAEARQPALGITEIAHLPMIGTGDPGCRQIIDAAFAQAPVAPTYLFRSDDHPTIQGLVGSGLAYAVLPRLAVDENDSNLAVIPIRPAPPPRRLGVAWQPDRRPQPALAPFVETAAGICRDLSKQWAARPSP